jgi:hypothetical protein
MNTTSADVLNDIRAYQIHQCFIGKATQYMELSHTAAPRLTKLMAHHQLD